MSLKMSISRFFEDVLGARLANPRWSYGAIDASSQRVFLRVWSHQIYPDGMGKKAQIDWKNHHNNSPGYPERLIQIDEIKKGAQGIAVIVEADKDKMAEGILEIADFNRDSVLILGDFSEDDQGTYAHILGQIPTTELAKYKNAQTELTFDVASIISKSQGNPTTKDTMVSARIGQGFFRMWVLQLWDHCCSVTGSTTLDAIRASHIKPWRESNDFERLDPKNGLPLIASLDALFDAGLISFDDHGLMLISSKLTSSERGIFNITGSKLSKPPSDETAQYLVHHRNKFFPS